MPKQPEIFFFDMDHTLINNDCDVSWKQFAVAEGLAPVDDLREADRFFKLYEAGQLPVDEFLLFQLNEFSGRTIEEMRDWSLRHFEQVVKKRIYADGVKAINSAKAQGVVAVLSATNSVLCQPLADYLGIEHIEATELEVIDGVFTGKLSAEYRCGEGKVSAARDFCAVRGFDLSAAAYYGDSYSDHFILDAVGFPYAVNPNHKLRECAEQKGWPILTWK
jgi:HAD superfamily hydrolase (TIGR01490 family)